MASVYLSGRTRTVRLRITITLQGKARYNSAASDGGSLGVGTDYTSVTVGNASLGWDGYSSAFGLDLAIGSKLLTGDPFGPRTRAMGVWVSDAISTTTNDRFAPMAHLGPWAAFSSTIVIDRVMQLKEVFSHIGNGERTDVFGSSGTCYERVVVDGTHTFYRFNGSFGMIPGAAVAHGMTSAFVPGIGYYAAALAESHWSGLGVNGGNIAVVWEANYIDAAGLPILPAPDVLPLSSALGEARWGSVSVVGPTGTGKRVSTATFAHFPRHAFEVEIAPLSLPSGAPVVQHHRLEVFRVNPLGGVTPTTGTDYFTAGGVASLLAGGTKWNASISSTVSGETTSTRAYNDFLPLVSKLSVSHIDARAHYQCRVRAPFDVLTLSQASGVNVPGGSGLSCPVGATSLALGGAPIGYRYLRVTAKTPVGTGSLLVESFLNGDAVSPTASKTLTTTIANTDTTIEIDLLETPGSTFLPDLELDTLQFTATGAAFTITALELFRRDESLVQCMSTYLSLPPIQMPNVTGWIEGYTDGVRSLTQAISGNTMGIITLSSITLRQLVAEINGTTRHNYSGWSPGFPYLHVDGGAAPSPSALLGWSATDAAPPRGGKGYGSNETYEAGDWSDSDVPTPALHGEGVIGSTLLLTGNATGGLTIQAQRFAADVRPGYLPGNAGFDGTDGADFGESESDHVTRVRFAGLFRGALHGMEVGTLRALPIEETHETDSGVTTAITPPNPVGQLVPRPSGFSLSSEPLQGTNSNAGDGYNLDPGFEFVTNTVDNAGGTNASEVAYPYHRQRQYVRLWTDAPSENFTAIEHDPPRGWLHLAAGLKVHTYWRESGTLAPLEAFAGDDLAVDAIRRLERTTGGRLLVLAEDGTSYKLYHSGDGGRTIGALLTMTNAASSLVVYDEARGWIVVWWEDSTSHQVKRRISRDGGASWESAQDCQWTPTGGASQDLEAELRDVKLVRELAGRFVMVVLPEGESTGVVLMSGNGGLDWTQVL